MSQTDERPPETADESVYRKYVLDVRIVETTTENGETRYRFEAGSHRGQVFKHPETATLYADVYFCTNGFEEEGTGDRGVPPEIVGAGRAVLASYFLTRPGTDLHWAASFFGVKPHRVREYRQWVRQNAEEIREGVTARGIE